jgi:hypothetical protein
MPSKLKCYLPQKKRTELWSIDTTSIYNTANAYHWRLLLNRNAGTNDTSFICTIINSHPLELIVRYVHIRQDKTHIKDTTRLSSFNSE